MAGVWDTSKGMSGIKGFKGAIFIDKAIEKDKDFITSPEEALKLVGHVLLLNDLGVKDECSTVAVYVERVNKSTGELTFDSIQHTFHTLTRYSGSGVDGYMAMKQQEMNQFKENIAAMSANHSRTMDTRAFNEYVSTFKKNAPPIKVNIIKLTSSNLVEIIIILFK